MASQFYARYVPPPRPAQKPKDQDARTGDEPPRKKKKSNGESQPKQVPSKQLASLNLKPKTPEARSDQALSDDKPKETALPVEQQSKVENGFHESNKAVQRVKRKKKKNRKDGEAQKAEDDGAAKNLQSLEKNLDSSVQDVEADGEDAHKKIRKKYETSKRREEALAERRKGQKEPEQDTPLAKLQVKGIQSLPQPAKAPLDSTKSTIQGLPNWLANPIYVKPEDTASFKDLGISDNILKKLHEQGFTDASAIQTAVLKSLLPGLERRQGDLCVSAATGSGKSLAYILPIIEALKARPLPPRLRALIVVPTRELVDQAKTFFQRCQADLKVGTAAGNRTRREEKEAFVKVEYKYDPTAYEALKQKSLTRDPWSWLDYSSSEDDEDDVDLIGKRPNTVGTYESTIDVLVATPGRLVDHVNKTKGFTLDDVQWLVIDEADKLLDQSFQQWIEVIMPALQKESEMYPGVPEAIVQRLRLPPRRVKKVILSASMTRDMSKLASLHLYRPALIALEDVGRDADERATQAFQAAGDVSMNIPAQLAEFAVAVRDGNDKPLYLLHLIDTEPSIASFTMKAGRMREASDTSSDGSSSGSSSDTNSSETSTSDEHLSSDWSSPESLSDVSSSDDSSDISTSSSDSSSDSDSDSDDSDDSESSSEIHSSSSNGSLSSRSRLFTHTPPSSSSPKFGMLIFTNTNENALRLCRLLTLLRPSLSDKISAMTKFSGSAAGRKTLAAFRKRQLPILVASDRASRGLDLKDLAHVVNYDMPTSVTSYVHRIGRTARAGASGTATTLVAHHEGRWFWNEIGRSKKIGRAGKVVRKEVQLDDIEEEDRQRYEEALEQLGKEARGD